MLKHEIEVTERGTVAKLSGALEFSQRQAFQAVIKAIETADGDHFFVDIRELDSVDSSGLGLLVTARKAAERRNMRVVLRTAQGIVREILGIAHFEQIFLIEE